MRLLISALLPLAVATAPLAGQVDETRAPAPDPGPPPAPVGVYGYPPLDVDRAEILDLLAEGRFEELDRRFQALESAAAADITRELELYASYGAFYGADEGIRDRLDEWVGTRPTSDAALVARSRYWNARAWTARGQDFTISDPMAAVNAARAGAEDIVRALELDPDNLGAYMAALRIESTSGWSQDAAVIVDLALSRFPASYWVRWLASGLMEPRWGGSFEMIEEMARDAQRYVGENPRLVTLLTVAEVKRAYSLTQRGDREAALRVLDSVRDQPTDWDFVFEHGHALYHLNEQLEAIPLLDSALAMHPISDNVLAYRGRAHYWAARSHVPPEQRVTYLGQAIADYIAATRLTHSEERLNEDLSTAVAARGRCSASPAHCFTVDRTGENPQGGGPWWWQAFVFVVSIPYTLYRVFVEGGRMHLLPAPLLGTAAVLWNLREWRRQRFWTPRIVHVLAALGLATIVLINVQWVMAGGAMWIQRYVVIAIFALFPYVAYLLFFGPKFLGRKHLAEQEREVAI